MMTMLIEHIAVTWILVGCLFLLLEAFGISGIGFLFAGFAAISVGGMITYGAIDPQPLSLHMVWFFALTAGWAALFWLTIGRNRLKKAQTQVSNIVGDTAYVSTPMQVGKIGAVKWSGTIMKARIAPRVDEYVSTIEAESEVEVVDVLGTLLLVKPKGFVIPTEGEG